MKCVERYYECKKVLRKSFVFIWKCSYLKLNNSDTNYMQNKLCNLYVSLLYLSNIKYEEL